MAKIIDITDKLKFEERPKLRVKGVELEINNKAVDMLAITPTLQKENLGAEEINLLYQTLFPEATQRKVEELELDFDDFGTLVMQAVYLLTENTEGETSTPATT